VNAFFKNLTQNTGASLAGSYGVLAGVRDEDVACSKMEGRGSCDVSDGSTPPLCILAVFAMAFQTLFAMKRVMVQAA